MENYINQTVKPVENSLLNTETPLDDRTKEEIKKEDNTDIYNISNFSI